MIEFVIYSYGRPVPCKFRDLLHFQQTLNELDVQTHELLCKAFYHSGWSRGSYNIATAVTPSTIRHHPYSTVCATLYVSQ